MGAQRRRSMVPGVLLPTDVELTRGMTSKTRDHQRKSPVPNFRSDALLERHRARTDFRGRARRVRRRVGRSNASGRRHQTGFQFRTQTSASSIFARLPHPRVAVALRASTVTQPSDIAGIAIRSPALRRRGVRWCENAQRDSSSNQNHPRSVLIKRARSPESNQGI